MEVTRSQLEHSLHTLAESVPDRLAGIHGPTSLAWSFGREARNFLGGGRAVLLQLAHPPVAKAIEEHSKTFVDLRGRFERTFDIVFAMTFGDLDEALSAARRLHRIHERVRGRLDDGTAYAANSKASLRWVYATLVDSIFAVRTLCGDALPPAICERYYRETKKFALLFGLEDDDLPRSYRDFRRYVDDAIASPMINVSMAAREMAHALLEPPHVALSPVANFGTAITSALLPPPLAAGFAIELDRGQKTRTKLAAGRLYAAIGLAPEQMRFLPRYLDAMNRVGARQSFERVLDRLSARVVRRVRRR